MTTAYKVKQFQGIWHRWKRVLEGVSSTGPAPDPSLLSQFAADVFGSDIQKIQTVNLIFNNHLVGKALHLTVSEHKLLIPHCAPESIADCTGLSKWEGLANEDLWFLPAHVTAPEAHAWTQIMSLSANERRDAIAGKISEMYSVERVARFVCTCRNVERLDRYFPTILEAAECHWLGKNSAATAMLVPVIEALLQDICSILGISSDESRERANKALTTAFERIVKYRPLASNNATWIPEDFLSFAFQAKVDYLAMHLYLLKNFLISHFYARTDDVNVGDPAVINRHAFAHHTSPRPASATDALKLFCIIETTALAFGYLINAETTDIYGRMHGAIESWSNLTIEEPNRPVQVLAQYASLLSRTASASSSSSVLAELNDIVVRRDVIHNALKAAMAARRDSER